MNKAKVTISRVSSRKGEGYISISIKDASSSLAIVEINMSPTEFAEAITGLSYCEADISLEPTIFTAKNIGKIRETKRIFVDKSTNYGKQVEEIQKSIEDSGELTDGWMLFDDGTRSQQNGKNHEAVLCRFVSQKEDQE